MRKGARQRREHYLSCSVLKDTCPLCTGVKVAIAIRRGDMYTAQMWIDDFYVLSKPVGAIIPQLEP